MSLSDTRAAARETHVGMLKENGSVAGGGGDVAYR